MQLSLVTSFGNNIMELSPLRAVLYENRDFLNFAPKI